MPGYKEYYFYGNVTHDYAYLRDREPMTGGRDELGQSSTLQYYNKCIDAASGGVAGGSVKHEALP
jgi:hypothetical protein